MTKASAHAVTRSRPDGRKSFLVYLPQDVIRRLKIAALDEERPAYLITEQAVRDYLNGRNRQRRAK
ncbi:MAG: hypothetical protein WDN01_07990 [Rhizomicrobium sp.]